jgi:hypothetical protein
MNLTRIRRDKLTDPCKSDQQPGSAKHSDLHKYAAARNSAINGFVNYEPVHSLTSPSELSRSENPLVDWRIDEIGTRLDDKWESKT